MPQPIITLTTDFGLSDHFVGAMQGVILRLCPNAQLIDISHQVSPFEITEAAFIIAQAYSYFPSKTVHLVVVDPGVGNARRPILLQAARQFFLAPDNGVLAMIYSREKHKVRHVTAERFFLKPLSHTFHGRDLFAPVAARLAAGAPPARFGPLITDYLRPDFEKPVRTGKRIWLGKILKVDHFGNLITNFHISEFPTVQTRPFALNVGPAQLTHLTPTYAQAPLGQPCLILGSSGYLEVAANQASAAQLLGCAPGAPLELTLY